MSNQTNASYFKRYPVATHHCGIHSLMKLFVIAQETISGCLFFTDFEFMIVSESEQKDYTITALLQRLSSISEKTSSALPVYMMMSKLDKLDGFKEYVHFSSLKTRVEFLSIPLKEAKGVITEYYRDGFRNLVKVLETNALDASANYSGYRRKTSHSCFPKTV